MTEAEREFVRIVCENRPFGERSVCAVQYAHAVREALTGKQELFNALIAEVPFQYAIDEFQQEVKLFLDSDVVSEKELFRFCLALIASKEPQRIKLGLLLMGFFEPLSQGILRDYCRKPEYAYYALKGAGYFKAPNQFYWSILQEEHGLCVTEALSLFHPVLPEHKVWMFEKGQYQTALPDFAAAFCLMSAELLDYFGSVGVNRENYSQYSHLLAYSALVQNVKQYGLTACIVQEYLKNAREYAKSIIDIAALSMLAQQMDPNYRGTERENYKTARLSENVPKENGWSTDLEKEVLAAAVPILQASWVGELVRSSLNPPTEDVELLLMTAYAQDHFNYVGYTIPFSFYTGILKNNPFHPLVLKILQTHTLGRMDYQEIQRYFTRNQSLWRVPEAELSTQISDWLCWFLKNMRRLGAYNEPFLLEVLSVPIPAVREEALKTLRKLRDCWTPKLASALKSLLNSEQDAKLRRQMERILNGKSSKAEKKEETVDFSDQTVTAVNVLGHVEVVMETEVAGLYYRNLEPAVPELQDGAFLRLKREHDNPYDGNAIMVATMSGYVIGYIPRACNQELAQAMDRGRLFYAIADMVDIGKKRVQIKICPSY